VAGTNRRLSGVGWREGFAGLLGLVPVHQGAYADVRLAATKHAIEHRLQVAFRSGLVRALGLELLAAQPGQVAGVIWSERVAVDVDDGQVLWLEALDAARDQVADRARLGAVEAAARLQLQHDRRGRILLLRR